MTRPAFLLSALGLHVANQFTDRLQPLGLHPRQFALLAHLAPVDGRSQQHLADSLGLHRNAMVDLVDGLEKRGLVERRPYPGDRRAHALHLTLSARVLLERGYRAADEHDSEILSVLEGPERTQLVSLLQALAGVLGVTPEAHLCMTQASTPSAPTEKDSHDRGQGAGTDVHHEEGGGQSGPRR